MLVNILKEILNVSLSGAIVALIIMLIKLLTGRRLPVRFHVTLWFILIIKLLIPFNIHSKLSIFNYVAPPINSVINPTINSTLTNGIAIERERMYEALRLHEGLNEVDSVHDFKYLVSPITPAADNNRVENKDVNRQVAKVPASSKLNWWTAAAYLWMTGVLSILLILMWSYVKTAIILKKQKTPNDTRLSNLFEECRHELNVSHAVHIKTLRVFSSPFVFGCTKPLIVLPEILMKNHNDDELRSIILHEMNHIKRYDPVLRLIITALQAVHWFNPIMWIAFNWMANDLECACDSSVIKNYSQQKRAQYASTLYRLAESQSSRRELIPPLAFGDSNVKRRIINIMRWRKHSIISVSVAVLIIITAAVLLLPGAVGSTIEPLLESGIVEADHSKVDELATNPPMEDIIKVISDGFVNKYVITDDEQELHIKIILLINNIVDNGSSSPDLYDYIKGSSDFEELVSLGEPAMEYMFDWFQRYNEDGLKEYIMAAACARILGVYDDVDGIFTTSGREWFYKYLNYNQDQFSFVDADYYIFKDSGSLWEGITLPERTDKTSIEEVIYDYLIARFRSGSGIEEKVFAAYHVYRSESNNGITSVYMLVRFSSFEFRNNTFTSGSGTGGIPVRMDLKTDERGQYDVISYKEPMDGDGWLTSIKEMFPSDLVKTITDRNELVKMENELVLILEDKAAEYVKSIGKKGATVSYKYVPELVNKSMQQAINKVIGMRREFPDWIGSREGLVKTGGPYPGGTLRCIMKTNAIAKSEDEYIITLTRIWDVQTNAVKPTSTWKYEVSGDSVTLVQEKNEDYMITLIK